MRFSKEHEWCKIENGIATIGITDYAQKELGDIVFIEMPEINIEYSLNDKFAECESVKAVSDVFIPVSGKIIEINESLDEEPNLVNEDAFGKGWMIKVKISDENEYNNLMTEEEYKSYLKEI